ncbi:initiation factor 2 subunit family-domain-containing protein [Chiua virens]|nr:initiation factor 2 subunit family-domain-containing protein [Chiua virens]
MSTTTETVTLHLTTSIKLTTASPQEMSLPSHPPAHPDPSQPAPPKSQKQMTKAERREQQEAQRAAKAAAKAAPSTHPAPSKPTSSHKQNASISGKGPISPSAGTPKKSGRGESKDVSHPSVQIDETPRGLRIFSHFGAPKPPVITKGDIHPAVVRLGLQFAGFKITGANARCIALLSAFKTVIQDYVTPRNNTLSRHLMTHLSPQITHLVSARPMSVSMGNAIRQLKLDISESDIDLPEQDAKDALCDTIDNYIRDRILLADQVIQETAGSKIKDGDVILTYARSVYLSEPTPVIRRRKGLAACLGVWQAIFCHRSRFKTYARRQSAAAISYDRIDSVYLSSLAVPPSVLPRTTTLFVGAHSLHANGAVFSRAGTAMVAMMAKLRNIPVVVCCETYKFSEGIRWDGVSKNELGGLLTIILGTLLTHVLGPTAPSPFPPTSVSDSDALKSRPNLSTLESVVRSDTTIVHHSCCDRSGYYTAEFDIVDSRSAGQNDDRWHVCHHVIIRMMPDTPLWRGRMRQGRSFVLAVAATFVDLPRRCPRCPPTLFLPRPPPTTLSPPSPPTMFLPTSPQRSALTTPLSSQTSPSSSRPSQSPSAGGVSPLLLPPSTVQIPPTAGHSPVDVDLGPLKSVSRLHARIEYEEEEGRFVLVVIGRNGAWVDGVWSGAGSRVPLGEKYALSVSSPFELPHIVYRSQIQIASRTFHFVLPPPAALEDSPSPSSASSVQRARSPSVDITSISPPSSLPSNSPSPRTAPALPPPKPPRSPEPQLPNSNTIPRTKGPPASTSTPASTSNAPISKKRKKPSQPPPKPDVMPPKPPFTYAQLCHRAIKAMGGKATLQDICGWMMDNYDWYRYNEGAGWENSVRHNLSSGRAFKKMERSTGEHGKGFFWSVDPQYEHTFEEQEARAAAAALAQSQSASHLAPPISGKDGTGRGSRKKDKAVPLDPPLKRSVKSGTGPLPPPLTSAPLRPVTPSSGQLVGSLAHAQTLGPFTTVPRVITRHADSGIVAPERKTDSTELGTTTSVGSTSELTSRTNASTAGMPSSGSGPSSSISSSVASSSVSASPFAALPPSVSLPIVVGPIPSSHPSSSTADPPPIVLHNNTLILSPMIFSSLATEQIKALEEMGAQKALEVLQGHIVRYLKERMGKKKRKKAPASGVTEKGGTKPTKGDLSGLSNPFTTTPLPSRTAQSTPTLQVPTPLSEQSAVVRPASLKATTGSTSDFRVLAKEGVPSSVDSNCLLPAQASDNLRSQTSIVVVDDEDDEEGRVTKRRKLGNEIESGTKAKHDFASAARISQAVDEDIDVDVC